MYQTGETLHVVCKVRKADKPLETFCGQQYRWEEMICHGEVNCAKCMQAIKLIMDQLAEEPS